MKRSESPRRASRVGSRRARADSADIRDDLLNSETGAPTPAGASALDVALVYPNAYRVGMSSLGFQAVYALGNAMEGVRVERFFRDLPGDTTLETRLPIGGVDVLAFSVAFVMDYFHVVEVLARAGLAPESRARRDDAPLIVAGGSAILTNRLPIYDLCDVFVHGAAERALPGLLAACARHRNDRRALLDSLDRLPGIEVTSGAREVHGLPLSGDPGDPRPPGPAVCPLEDLDAHPTRSAILTDKAELGRRCLVEISRGCPHRCTFCWVGHNVRPYVVRSVDNCIALMETELARCRSFGLIAAAVGAHPGIDEICAWSERAGAALSFSSLRVEDVTDGMLRALARSGQRSLTLAPEAGSARLRRLLGKRIEDARVFDVIERAVGLGMRDVKLYFMTGLPTETDDEALEIADFVARLRERFVAASRPRGVVGSLHVNCGVYVPHPGTPLARMGGLPEADAVRRRAQRLCRALRRIPNARAVVEGVETARIQTALCHGDRAVGRLLRLALAAGGDIRRAFRQWKRTGGAEESGITVAL